MRVIVAFYFMYAKVLYHTYKEPQKASPRATLPYPLNPVVAPPHQISCNSFYVASALPSI